jgi:hypothetical protein
MGIAMAITLKTRKVSNANLVGNMSHSTRWYIGWIVQKCSQEAHCTKLETEPQPVVVSAPASYQFTVVIAEMEVAGQLRGCWLS